MGFRKETGNLDVSSFFSKDQISLLLRLFWTKKKTPETRCLRREIISQVILQHESLH